MNRPTSPLFAEELQLTDEEEVPAVLAGLCAGAVILGAGVAWATYRLLAWHWGLCV